MVRPAVSPEVYKQKQNTLFIFECVEHRMFKVTWTRVCVYSFADARPSAHFGHVARGFVTLGSDIRYARLGRDTSTVLPAHPPVFANCGIELHHPS